MKQAELNPIKLQRNTKDLTKNKPERQRTKAAALMRHVDDSEKNTGGTLMSGLQRSFRLEDMGGTFTWRRRT